MILVKSFPTKNLCYRYFIILLKYMNFFVILYRVYILLENFWNVRIYGGIIFMNNLYGLFASIIYIFLVIFLSNLFAKAGKEASRNLYI